MRRMFVPTDRDAKVAEEVLRKLGTDALSKDYGFNLLDYGEFSALIADTGADCVCHEVADVRKTPQASELLNVIMRLCPSWGARLDTLMMKSDACVFFPGRQVTTAYLFPILAHIIDSNPTDPRGLRKVALVGWQTSAFGAVINLLGAPEGRERWLRSFPSLDGVVEWFTYGRLVEPRKDRRRGGPNIIDTQGTWNR